MKGSLESFAAAPALALRAGCKSAADLGKLPDDHPTFDCAARYLAILCVNLILLVSPEKIVLSGGVLRRSSLFPAIRKYTLEVLNGYISVPEVLDHIDRLIVPSVWQDDA